MPMRLLIFALVFSAAALADGLPEETVVTPSNAAKLGFRLEPLDLTQSEVRGFEFWFPPKISGCRAGRVQVALTDLRGKQLFIASADYTVTVKAPHLLLAYHPKIMDMYLAVQYCCTKSKFPGCKEAYTIKSVTNYFSNDTKP